METSESPQTARLSEAVENFRKRRFYCAVSNLSRLEFGTHYDYEVYLDGLRVPLPLRQLLFRHKKCGVGERKKRKKFQLLRSSSVRALTLMMPITTVRERLTAAIIKIFQTIAAQKPDAMIWLGDNIYYREADWLNEKAMRYRYAHGRSLPEMQELLASTHHYAIWDDHDFGPNNSDRAYRTRETSLKIFKDYWANSTYGTAETPGVFGSFEWNDVEFFLLDDRYHRTPNRAKENAQKTYVRRRADAMAKRFADFEQRAFQNHRQRKSDDEFSFAPDEGLGAISRRAKRFNQFHPRKSDSRRFIHLRRPSFFRTHQTHRTRTLSALRFHLQSFDIRYVQTNKSRRRKSCKSSRHIS